MGKDKKHNMMGCPLMALIVIVAVVQQHADAVDLSPPTTELDSSLYDAALSGTVFLERDSEVGWRLPKSFDPMQALMATASDFHELEKEEDAAAEKTQQQSGGGAADQEKATTKGQQGAAQQGAAQQQSPAGG